jgi:hypothetical protein
MISPASLSKSFDAKQYNPIYQTRIIRRATNYSFVKLSEHLSDVFMRLFEVKIPLDATSHPVADAAFVS